MNELGIWESSNANLDYKRPGPTVRLSPLQSNHDPDHYSHNFCLGLQIPALAAPAS